MRKRKRKVSARLPATTNPTHVSEPLGPGKRLGTMEVAARLGCHPMTVPRLVSAKRLSPPLKWMGRNTWTEEQIQADIEKLIEAGKGTDAA
jgi:hypothetical protein